MLERPPKVTPIITRQGPAVVYTSAIQGNAYQTVHLCGAMSVVQASKAFYREHANEVEGMLREGSKNAINLS